MATIEHAALFADDLPALRDFYLDAFDLRVAFDNSRADPAGYFLADDRGAVLELIARSSGESNANQRFVCHLAFWVDDFAASRADLERRGIAFESGTEVMNDEVQTAFFLDPQGNRCQIVRRRRPLVG